jgi:hypothetical protein
VNVLAIDERVSASLIPAMASVRRDVIDVKLAAARERTKIEAERGDVVRCSPGVSSNVTKTPGSSKWVAP